MGRGGARNRGPAVRSPHSEASRQRRAGALILPCQGHDGDPPEFPLPDLSDREAQVWQRLWRTPQASAWSVEEWRWQSIALFTRWSVRAEAENASAAVLAQVVRLADQVGLSPAGLVENGWRVAEPEDESSVRASTTLRNGQPSSLERARQRSRSRFPTSYEPQDPGEAPDPRTALRDEYGAPTMRERIASLQDGNGPVA